MISIQIKGNDRQFKAQIANAKKWGGKFDPASKTWRFADLNDYCISRFVDCGSIVTR